MDYQIRHLSGARSGEISRLTLAGGRQMTIGRDPGADLCFEGAQNPSVSRWHARLSADPAGVRLHDLGSANGVLVNHESIAGARILNAGDLVQLGVGGPSFLVEPADGPDPRLDATRVIPHAARMQALNQRERGSRFSEKGVSKMLWISSACLAAAVVFVSVANAKNDARDLTPPAVEFKAPPAPAVSAPALQTARPAEPVRSSPRRPHTARQAPRATARSGALPRPAPVLLAKADAAPAPPVTPAPVVATPAAARSETRGEAEPLKSPAQIVRESLDAVVELGVTWQMVNVPTGRPVHLAQIDVEPNRRGKQLCSGKVSLWMRSANGPAPVLTLDQGDELYRPLGGQQTGSGVIVDANGFVLTNVHVAAPWNAPADWTGVAPPCLVDFATGTLTPLDRNLLPRQWIPSQASVTFTSLRWNRKRGRDAFSWTAIESGEMRGRSDLEAMFAKTKDRYKAEVVRVHDNHDVCLLKMSVPFRTHAIPLHPNDLLVQEGERVVIIGYPRTASYSAELTRALLAPRLGLAAQPTVDGGLIGRFATEGVAGWRNLYQLQTPSLGVGVSGGAVLDESGRAIAIVNSAIDGGRATGAVPIRYGLELLTARRILR